MAFGSSPKRWQRNVAKASWVYRLHTYTSGLLQIVTVNIKHWNHTTIKMTISGMQHFPHNEALREMNECRNSRAAETVRQTSSDWRCDLCLLRASRASLGAQSGIHQLCCCCCCCSPLQWPWAASAFHLSSTACSAFPSAWRSLVSPKR